MTDCSNVAMREQLPDLVHGTCDRQTIAQVEAHVATCADCAEELALIRLAVRVRPTPASADYAGIIRQLPKPAAARTRSLGLGRTWRMAAGIGVIIASAWSVQLIRSGSVATLTAGPSDTMQLAAAAETVLATSGSAPQLAVSIGSVRDYSDEELEQMLQRVDRWDGATSAEAGVTAPLILPVATGGTIR